MGLAKAQGIERDELIARQESIRQIAIERKFEESITPKYRRKSLTAEEQQLLRDYFASRWFDGNEDQPLHLREAADQVEEEFSK
nr:hypothetical protein 46 [Burkholderiaceae bacterium]